MENRIKEYELFIEKETKKNLTEKERNSLGEYHKEMILFFEHERLVHLIIMLFFVAVSLVFLGIFVWTACAFGIVFELTCLYLLTLISVILSIAYVKHYYFLENHVQSLYDYTRKIRLAKN